MESSAAPNSRPKSLLQRLEKLGAALPTAELPAPGDSTAVIAAIAYFLGTGSLEPPAAPVAAGTQQRADAEAERVQSLEEQLARLQAQVDAAAPTPVPPVTAPPEAS